MLLAGRTWLAGNVKATGSAAFNLITITGGIELC
jgi:hypothetical protein